MVVTNDDGAKFLLYFFKRLHEADFVDRLQRVDRLSAGLGSGRRTKRPVGRVAAYLDRLDRLAVVVFGSDDARVRERNANFLKRRLKSRLHASWVMDELPESYVKSRGHEFGGVEAERVRGDQVASLDRWVDYLVSESAADYSSWFKYWVLESMPHLGSYKNGTFNKRSKDTVAPFAELNTLALARTRDVVMRNVQSGSQSLSFKRIYESQLAELLPSENQELQQVEGEWVKYSDKEKDGERLFESLNGHHTGWCIAEEGSAGFYVGLGEIHVFYSLDDQKRPTIPRAAIVRQNDEITDVSGIAENDNLDDYVIKVVEEKLYELPNNERSLEALRDLNRLNEIYGKHLRQDFDFLTDDDLVFLYEVERPIKRFGLLGGIYPRVREVMKNRRQGEDVMRAYRAVFPDFCSNPVFEGDVNLRVVTNVKDGLKLPEHVKGDVNLERLESSEGLDLPKTIDGRLGLPYRLSVEGLLELPDSVGSLELYDRYGLLI